MGEVDGSQGLNTDHDKVRQMRNRLTQETSPYLLQHADNPVDWQPWDEAALADARQADKPILLSIGYSACHWCHVMAHESFEDPATAAVMNAHFINVKVDREERPDLDKVYQTAHQLLTRQPGGWPLTMFLDPETLVPFFAGTYFPKTPRLQRPGFADLLLRIREVFADQRQELEEQGRKLMEAMSQLDGQPDGGEGIDDGKLIQLARTQLGEQYDPQEGGFGSAPKFPMPAIVDRILRHQAYRRRTGNQDRDGLDIVMTTLTKMARGGIYDHLGGGFCRYATDRKWMVPHFEKMLYDNGQLLSLYADALSLAPDALFQGVVRETAEWLIREMRHPEGGFFAALDADSEGDEGRFYLWRRGKIRKLLTDDEYLVIETLYGIDKPANFEGKWNLHRYDAWRAVVQRLSLAPSRADELLASAKRKLFEERATRVRPGLDDKVLTSWNALAIKGMVKAAVALDEPAWLHAATQAADFIRNRLWRNGVLFATWKDGTAKHRGYLDDYANLVDALLALLSAQWRDTDARFALDLADALLDDFLDRQQGGFYFTAHAGERLIHRPKPMIDDAQPPGNGVAARVLARLGHLFGEVAYLDAAAGALDTARPAMERYAAGYCTLLTALEEQLHPDELVILRGASGTLREWRQALADGYRPWRRVYAIPADATVTPPYLPASSGPEPVAFICSGLSCSLPIRTIGELQKALG